jgi:hypothetical protein
MFGNGVGHGKTVIVPVLSPIQPDPSQEVVEFIEVEVGSAKQDIAEFPRGVPTILNTETVALDFV